jgi:hypothetical protein
MTIFAISALFVVSWLVLAAILDRRSLFRVKYIVEVHHAWDRAFEGLPAYKVQRRNPLWPFWFDHKWYYESTGIGDPGHTEPRYYHTKGEAISSLEAWRQKIKGEVSCPKNKVVYP